MQIKTFLINSKPIAVVLSLIIFCSWSFLAATTTVFAYNVISPALAQHFAGFIYALLLVAGLGIVYVIVDAGITPMMRWFFRTSDSKLNEHGKRFRAIILAFLVFKVVATMTSSIWAAPEVADIVTDSSDTDKAVLLLQQADSLQTIAETNATTRLQQLEATETERVRAARLEGDKLVMEAVNRGNKWQKASYRKIGFAWLLSPKNKEQIDYEYAQGIKKALNQKEALIADARNRTQLAATTALSVATDTAYSKKAALLTHFARTKIDENSSRKKRRKNIVWVFDFIAVFTGIGGLYIMMLREKAGGVEIKEKNVSSILGKWMEKLENDFLMWLEASLGVDIDGDGYIGDPENNKEAISKTELPPHSIEAHLLNFFKKYAPVGAVGTQGGNSVGFDAIKMRESVVATAPTDKHTDKPPQQHTGSKIIKQTTYVDDNEGKIKEQLARITRYRSKWRDRGKGGGKPSTIALNVEDALITINELLQETPHLEQITEQRIREARNFFNKDIKPEIGE